MLSEQEKRLILSRIFARTKESNGCLLWTGAKSSAGYGCVWVRGRNVATHRMVAICRGDDLTNKIVRHKCDTPACVNPMHLEIGTQSENMIDAWQRNRRAMRTAKKLNYDIAAEIRERGKTEHHKALADAYNVSLCTIKDILKERTWKLITQ